MTEKLHVLHVVGRLNMGGAESRIMDLYRQIDRQQIQFDFVEHTRDRCAYEDEIERLGGRIYHMPRFRFYNILSYKKAWKQFLEEHKEIKIVHGHMTSTAGIYLPIARKMGIYTIAHARSAGVDPGIKGILTRVLRLGLLNKCDQAFSCSTEATCSVFGKKALESGRVKFFPNAINVEAFTYDPEMRKKIRAELGIQDKQIVLGHVGRFDAMKNHGYMVEILEECLKRNENYRLLFLGEGPLMEEIKELARRKDLEEKIIFAGRHSNIADYYQAFDYFLLPSLYEGLPGTAIEAQVSGLRGILSANVTGQAIVTDLLSRKSINHPASEWAETIERERLYIRQSYVEEVRKAGFDVREQVKWLQSFYLEKRNRA